MENKPRVLVVEDEQGIGNFISTILTSNGYTALRADNGASAQMMLTSHCPDLVVLDLGLPDMDGLDVARWIRNQGMTTPILVLTARADEVDLVVGLDAGADDYVTKPFAFAELLARVRRRLAASAVARAVPAEGPDWLAVHGLGLDLRERRAHVDGTWVELSTREFELLRVLLAEPDTVLTREILLEQAWGVEHDPGTNVVDVYVGYLRRKLDVGRIETVRGQGYRLLSRPRPAGR